MRVLFLTLYPESVASARYRVHQYLPYLESHGLECTVLPALTESQFTRLTGPHRRGRPFWYHLAEFRRRLFHILGAGRYDLVFVQKGILSAYLKGAAFLLKQCAPRMVYDFDDAVHLAAPHRFRSPWRMLEDPGQIVKLWSAAGLVLAGNQWLADAASLTGARTEVLPTVVDTDRFRPRITKTNPFCIGWVGSPSTAACLAPAMEALGSTDGAALTFIGATSSQVPIENAQVRPWSLEDEVGELQCFTVGIMPLLREEWMRGKCALKALLYMACGIPCVATPFGAVCDIIKHGENGLFADSTEEWRDALEELKDPALRMRLGEAGRATVEERFALAHHAPRLLDLLESVA